MYNRRGEPYPRLVELLPTKIKDRKLFKIAGNFDLIFPQIIKVKVKLKRTEDICMY
jgi:hypothetical protein